MKNSAIVMPGFIGDFVLALSVVIRKSKQSDESLTLIVPQHLIPLCTLLTSLPYFPYRRGNRSELTATIDGIKSQKFDTLYLLSGSFSAAWFGVRTGIARRRAMRGDLLSSFIVSSTVEGSDTHITHDYAKVLEVGEEEPERWQGVPIRVQSEYNANVVVLCPGVGHESTGRWPGFREIVKLLPKYDFIILGGKEDMDAAKAIASHLPHRVRNLAGTTSIETAAAIIASASVVVSNHCGLMQLAGFLGAPVVGIFGPSSPLRFRPLGDAVRCAVSSEICENCKKRSCIRDTYRCLNAISPDSVLALASEIVR